MIITELLVKDVGLQTRAIHGHEFFDDRFGVFKVPIYQSAIFEQPDKRTGLTRTTERGTELKYSREENPTVISLEKLLSKLDEGGDALCFSSGMAAIAALYMATLRKDSRIVLSKEAYGTTIQLANELRKFGIEVVLAGPDTDSLIEAITPDVTLVLIETMTNPTLKVVDVPEVAKRCNETETLLAVDNTFVTPVLYRPLNDGVNFVIHSMTKYLAGHNDVIAGAIISDKSTIRESLWDWRRMLGGILAPFEAFLVLRGLKTLGLRVRRHCENAMAIAEFLKEHPKVEEVLYPGLPDNTYHGVAKRLFKGGMFGGVVSFKVKGGKDEALRVLKTVELIKPSPSLGGPESLLTYPVISASKTLPPDLRKELGITDNLLRLSVGLEDVNDIIADLDRALGSLQ